MLVCDVNFSIDETETEVPLEDTQRQFTQLNFVQMVIFGVQWLLSRWQGSNKQGWG